MSLNIASAVVLYNPDDEFYKNVLSYIDEVDVLFLIDNSNEKANVISTIESKWRNKVKYICLGENKGVANALNIALQMAENYDYLMTMDQDTSFATGMMKEYKNKVQKVVKETRNITSFGPSWQDEKDNNIQYPTKLITSANIINVDVANKIGGYLNDLFIDEVDHEFCFRLLDNGYRIARFPDIKINHSLGNPFKKKLFHKSFNLYAHNTLRRYYMIRNRLYVIKKYPKYAMLNFDHYFTGVIRNIIKILLFEKQRKIFLKIFAYAVKDFWLGNMGKCTIEV